MENDILFQARTVQTANIKTLFEVLKKVLTEVNLIITNDKIKIVSLNNTNISLIYVKLLASKFEYFYCDRDNKNPLIISINTESICRIIKTIKHDETISFYMVKSDLGHLYIKKENNNRNNLTKYKLELYQVIHQQITIPDIEYDTIITMASSEFQKVCKDYYSLGAEFLDIKNVGEQLFISASGKNCEGESLYGLSDSTNINNKGHEIIQGKYNIEYLLLFSKAKDLSTTMEIYLKNEYPIILNYKIGTLGELKFIVSVIEEE